MEQPQNDLIFTPNLLSRFPSANVTPKLVLEAVSNAGKNGATWPFINKYVDSKIKTFANKSEIKLHLRNAVAKGKIEKNWGTYTIKKRISAEDIGDRRKTHQSTKVLIFRRKFDL
ncbi:hypothetical protein AVEN_126043-1 [Araneus ventricosus]|uniref:Uncharacterized protein n=1 Tax=Araneus ventricosus TaxID=182803 RepID=A0A4Y2EWZ2_ARAVE|nr:hypothetical protein AVEN_126043-1 [Araneus ventricosus]